MFLGHFPDYSDTTFTFYFFNADFFLQCGSSIFFLNIRSKYLIPPLKDNTSKI